MCELFGMSFNMEVSPKFSFKALREHGNRNPDGWGLAWYPKGKVQLIKEPTRATGSILAGWLPNYIMTGAKTFVGHLRQKSNGAAEYLNTHPFCRRLNRLEYVFAHNGTLKDEFKDHLRQNINHLLGWFRPTGNTDSECAFCHILRRIDAEQTDIRSEAGFNWLLQTYKDIEKHGSFNCILTDGEFLFCYRSADGNSLYFLRRKKPFGTNVQLNIGGKVKHVDLSELKDERTEGYIIATEKLTENENWMEFNPRELIVIKTGKMRYTNSLGGRKDFIET